MPQLPTSDIPERRHALRDRYRSHPEAAWVRERAQATPSRGATPMETVLALGAQDTARWPVVVHEALGGPGTGPTPGQALSGALAGCLLTSAHISADALGVALLDIEVQAVGELDARGCLLADATVPVGFQHLRCDIRVTLLPDIGGESLRLLMAGTERGSVLLQTLKRGTEVAVHWHIDQDLDEPTHSRSDAAPATDDATPSPHT